MDGIRKTAIFLLTLKGKISGEIFKRLSEPDQEKVLVEIASPAAISPDERAGVMDDFLGVMESEGIYASGGLAEAEALLEQAFGSKRAARDMTDRLQTVIDQTPFSMFNDSEGEEVYSFLSTENPQTIALVLSYLPAEKAAQVLELFPARKQNQIAARVASMATIAPEAVEEVEGTLKEKFQGASQGGQNQTDGPVILAKIMTKVAKERQDSVLESLEQRNPEAVEKIRENMFTFEDVTMIDDMAFRGDIGQLPCIQTDLALALKGASDAVKDKFLTNMPEKMKNRVEGTMNDLPPQRGSDVAAAQRVILDEIRKLEEAGKIKISLEQEEMYG